jgi:predicted regulator of Ras-like GTPase activity (Roadblock/LC7/MglB family)
MTDHLQRALDRITRVRGVRGAMLVAATDGLLIAEAAMEGVRTGAAAALSAALFGRLGRGTSASGAGVPTFVHLEAERGALLAVPAGDDVLLVTIADAEVNVGLARLEMLRAVEEVT